MWCIANLAWKGLPVFSVISYQLSVIRYQHDIQYVQCQLMSLTNYTLT